ncbi:MAG: LPS export ABC transporter ATP-binding protein [Variibacter sp.]|nr:LPS export ABC transporter ATP-binding protein [Variibacter sp.]
MGPPRRRPAVHFRRTGPLLVVQGITKTIRGRQIVEDVSLTLRRGETVGLLGPSGAGKTTVFSMVMGVIIPDQGEILLDNEDVTHLPLYERARRGISYLPQEPSVFRGLTVEQNLLLVLEAHEPDRQRRQAALDRLIDQFSIGHIRKNSAARLSGGERRRCEIARALASNPGFVLLDEPFAGIDPLAVNEIRRLVRFLTRRGIGVLITDHNVRETLGIIDRAYILESGRVLMDGDVQSVVSNRMVQEIYLGAGFRL